jgi:hypothetical protein
VRRSHSPSLSIQAVPSAPAITPINGRESTLSKLTRVARRQQPPIPINMHAKANAGAGSVGASNSADCGAAKRGSPVGDIARVAARAGLTRKRIQLHIASGTLNRLTATAKEPNRGENAVTADKTTAAPSTNREKLETFMRPSPWMF